MVSPSQAWFAIWRPPGWLAEWPRCCSCDADGMAMVSSSRLGSRSDHSYQQRSIRRYLGRYAIEPPRSMNSPLLNLVDLAMDLAC